ncbi:hypothetical protein D3C76_1696320 [compost metagenome]
MLVFHLAGDRVFPAVIVFALILASHQRQNRLTDGFTVRVLDPAEIGIDQPQVGAMGEITLAVEIDNKHIEVVL